VVYACDARWWRHYGAECAAVCGGELWAGYGPSDSDWEYVPAQVMRRLRFIEVAIHDEGLSMNPARVNGGLNSGYQAIGLASLWGCRALVLLGYDMQKTGGETHFHGQHPHPLPNLGDLPEWRRRMVQLGIDLRGRGVAVLNATRATALTCFERASLDEALARLDEALARLEGSGAKNAALANYHVAGMHGMGDSLHQRAVVRQLMRLGRVYLETPWPSIYHDLAGDRLLLINKRSSLRTQAKNASREAGRYSGASVPGDARPIRVAYSPDAVRRLGSVLAAMLSSAKCETSGDDFRFPVPAAWLSKIDARIASWQTDRPILVYRPLVERSEWGGCRARNPDHAAYAALLRSIRERFFVVSIADLQPKQEWIVGEDIGADVVLHNGELEFESLAALFSRAALVFASPGFAVPLAQAVGTSVVCVFGGYEDSRSFSAGAKLAPYLGIDTVKPCQCFSHNHSCQKAIDVAAATAKLRNFAGNAISRAVAPRS
jgi:hypothetical protein